MGDVSRLSAKEAQALFPPLRAGLGGIFISGGGRVDGRSLTACLLRAAGSRGATILQGHAAVAVEAERVVGVDVAGERIPADCVVVTAGAWIGPGAAGVGPRLAVEPQRGQIVHLRLEGARTEDWPVILPPGSHYIVPFDSGRIVAGATRETGSGFDYRITAAGQAEVLAEALGIAPGLGVATVLETRVGFRPAGLRGAAVAGTDARHRGTGGRHRARGGGPYDWAVCRTVAGGTGDRAASVA